MCQYFFKTLVILLATSVALPLFAQDGCDIAVKINGAAFDTLWLGHPYGKRAEPDFYALPQSDGSFNLKTDRPLPAGLYAILYRRGKGSPELEYFCCWIAEGQRKFSIVTDFSRLAKARVEGSVENACLLPYLARYEKFVDTLNQRTNDWKSFRTEAGFREMVRIQETLRKFQENTLQGCVTKAPMTADLIRQTLFLTPPDSTLGDPTDWPLQADQRHRWMRAHYFDRMNLGSGNFLKFPLWVDRADYFFSKMPPPQPDSMISMIEELLHRLQPDSLAYRYYFRYMMNSMSRIGRYRTDEAYVYFVRNYVEKGKTAWLSQDRREKYLDDAERMEPLFVGKKVPDATFFDKNSQPRTLYETKAPYLLMIFWLHDCGHCRKEIPTIGAVYQRWKDKGLQVFSVCGSPGDNGTASCYEFAAQAQMPPEWVVVSDPQRRSRFSKLYNVSSYPRLILIDADKKVLFKHLGEASAELLEAEFSRFIR